jgi:hypothetical protein
MAPRRRDVGLVIASADPVAADVVASAQHPLPITTVGLWLEGLEIAFDGQVLDSWRSLPSLGFEPHPGWVGHIEREDRSHDSVARASHA